jgi:hypothetical protein
MFLLVCWSLQRRACTGKTGASHRQHPLIPIWRQKKKKLWRGPAMPHTSSSWQSIFTKLFVLYREWNLFPTPPSLCQPIYASSKMRVNDLGPSKRPTRGFFWKLFRDRLAREIRWDEWLRISAATVSIPTRLRCLSKLIFRILFYFPNSSNDVMSTGVPDRNAQF